MKCATSLLTISLLTCQLIGLAAALAQEKPKAVWNMNSGLMSCGSWIEARRNRDNPLDRRFIQAKEWTSGFLTAYNFYVPPNGNILAGTDPEGAYAWIDSYCRQYPTEPLLVAAGALIDHLGGNGGRGFH
jgi:hypothetical protein